MTNSVPGCLYGLCAELSVSCVCGASWRHAGMMRVTHPQDVCCQVWETWEHGVVYSSQGPWPSDSFKGWLMCQVNWAERYLSYQCGNCHEVLIVALLNAQGKCRWLLHTRRGCLALAWPLAEAGYHWGVMTGEFYRGQASLKSSWCLGLWRHWAIVISSVWTFGHIMKLAHLHWWKSTIFKRYLTVGLCICLILGRFAHP